MTKEVNQLPEIFSSTGSLGESHRQYGRIYRNHPVLIEDHNILRYHVTRMSGNLGQGGIGRIVFRGVATEEAVKHALIDRNLSEHIEVMAPLDDFGFAGKWLVMIGKNSQDRRGCSRIKIVSETEEYPEVTRSAESRIEAVLQEGYEVTHSTAGQEMMIAELWGHTFGWTFDEVQALSQRLRAEKDFHAQNRSLWVSMIINKNKIITAAMAERLRIPVGDKHIDLIENTEWKTRIGFENQGFMTATLIDLNSQVIRDLDATGICSLIFAECNFATRSDRAAHGAGFVVPDRVLLGSLVPQVLSQNVEVEGEMQDFTYMFLTKEAKERYYSAEQVEKVLKGVGRHEYSGIL